MENQHYILKKYSKPPVFVFSVFFLLFHLWFSPARAGNVITSGTIVKVSSGTFVTTAHNVVVENGATLVIEGTLCLKNNFTNQNQAGYLGPGILEFSGTTPQSLMGQNTIGSLVVNNPAGLDISGNAQLTTNLTLQNGHLRLGPNNMTLGSMALVTGTPSATSMVIATGTGELRKSFSGVSSFTFPVGDDSGIAEYSPVTLNFTGGTFAVENYVGVKLTNSAFPEYSGNRLNRYWSLSQSGITDPQYDAVFYYVTADANGVENYIKCVQVEPTPIASYNPANTSLHQLTASGLGTFGVFTGIATTIIQDFALNIGWNIISAYVIPDNLELKDIFQPLIDTGKLKKVIDEAGKTLENFGAFGGWKNNIGNLNSAKGYKVIVTEASTLSLEGTPVSLSLDIALATGWNIISYPSATAQDAKALVQSLIDAGKLKKVMDEAGKTIENFGAFGGWKNNIGNFLPGKGYKVNVLENCTLTIPANGIKAAIVVPEVLASTHFTKVYTGNGTEHTNINLVNLQASGLRAGDEIGVFDGKLCVGSATIGSEQLMDGSISIEASADDGLGESLNGFVVGHRVNVKLYRNGQTYPLTLTKLDGQDVFGKNASLFAQVSMVGTTGIEGFDNEISFRCYPNPFKEQVTIVIQSANSEKLEVNIYAMDGKLVRKLYREQTKIGGTLVWDGRNDHGVRVIAGTYMIKANDRIEKIVLKK
jgi:hypothetical protein